jgi:hypothetical protein
MARGKAEVKKSKYERYMRVRHHFCGPCEFLFKVDAVLAPRGKAGCLGRADSHDLRSLPHLTAADCTVIFISRDRDCLEPVLFKKLDRALQQKTNSQNQAS